MMRYLSEMIWFPAAFLAGNISFEPSWPSATGPPAPAARKRGPPRSPATASSKGLRLPARSKAACKLPGGDLEYIDVTVTGMHYDTGAAAPEGRA
jgi:hypothetical protein